MRVAQIGETCAGRLLMLDALYASWHSVKLRGRDPECAACGENPSVGLNPCAWVAPLDQEAPSWSRPLRLVEFSSRPCACHFRNVGYDAAVSCDCRTVSMSGLQHEAAPI